MKWNEYWFWPEDSSGRPWSGRTMIILVMVTLVISEWVLFDPQHASYYDKHMDPVMLVGILLLLLLVMLRRKKPSA